MFLYYNLRSCIHTLKSKNITNSDDNTESNESDNSLNNKDSINFNYEENNKLGLYIRILLSQNNNIIEFIEKLNYMCTILSDPNKKYDIKNPYDN